MATEYGYGKIITNGLALNLNTADQFSYTSGSTIWNDSSGNNYSGSLTNGPTYTSTNGGSIVFDGVNDYCLTSYINNPTYFTFECIFKINDASGIYRVIASKYNGAGNDYWMGLSSGNIVFSTNGTILDSGVTVSLQPYYIVSCTISSTAKEIYVNGALRNSAATVSTSPGGGIMLATFGQSLSGYYSAANISSFKFYERALNATEILKNFDAQKGRFRLT